MPKTVNNIAPDEEGNIKIPVPEIDTSKLAPKEQVENVQNQVNNLVLGAIGDGNNPEVVQARGDYTLLNERLQDDEERIKHIGTKFSFTASWVIGGMTSDGSTTGASTTRIRSALIFAKQGDSIYVKTGYKMSIYRYSLKAISAANLIDMSGWITGAYTFDRDCYFVILLADNKNSTITNETINKYISACEIFLTKPIDTDYQINDFAISYAKLNQKILEKYKNKNIDWQIKSVDLSGLRYVGATNRMASNVMYFDKGDVVTCKAGYKFWLFFYENEDMTSFINSTNWRTQSYTFTNGGYAIILFADNNNRTITTENIDTYKDNCISTNESIMEVTETPFIPKYNYFGNFNNLFKTKDLPAATESSSFNLDASTITDIYNLYDQLLPLLPNRTAKNLIGYGGKADGTQDTSLPIYEYVFSTRSNSIYNDTLIEKSPTILIVCGIHGGTEKSTGYSVYHLLKQMYEEKNEILEGIRTNFNIKVIPIASPYSYNNNLRVNARGVNLARNFSHGWDKASSDPLSTEYRGQSMYSEIETQALLTWLRSNKDAMMLLDFHNCFTAKEYSWITSEDFNAQYIYSGFSRRMSDYWYGRYNLTDEGKFIGRNSKNETHPSIADECRYTDIKYHCTIEVNVNGFTNKKYSQSCIEAGADIIGNYILSTASYEQRIL